MRVDFQEWLPDLPQNNSVGANIAENVLPALNSYRPFRDLTPFSEALSARPLGSFAARANDGNIYLFAGTTSALWKLDGDAWVDVSKVGGYTTGDGERWTFSQFGDFVVASNYSDTPQVYQLGVSTDFADLTGSPPKWKYSALIGDFLVVANTNSGGSQHSRRIQWPDIDSITSWTTGAPPSQADFQDIAGEGGQCQGIVGGSEYGTIFFEKEIWRMTYIGPPYFFRFDKMESNKGTPAPGSIVPVNRDIHYLGQDGFYKFDGQVSVPTGSNKIDKTFYQTIANDYVASRVNGGADPINKIIFFSAASTNSAAGEADRLFILNYELLRWSYALVTTRYLFSTLQVGFTLETLDGYGSSDSIDALPFTLDSRVWQGGASIIAAFDVNNKLAFFTGSNLQAMVDTGETQLFPDRRGFISSVRPICDTNDAQISIGYRDRTGDDITESPFVAQNAIGDCNFRISARYQSAKVKIPAGASWNHIQGVDFMAVPEGAR